MRQRVGDFAVEGILGSGGMGVVYRARSPGGAPVAIKVLAGVERPEDVDRFEREAGARIEHPNVVRVLETHLDHPEVPHIVFELLSGESLDARLARGTMTAAETIDMGLQVAAGLGAAHDAGLIHRDVKPANIFACADGTYKVLDFGIAHWAGRNTRLTRTGFLLGSPSYMAPEQARGDQVIDVRADVWGAGAVLYHSLCGRPPFAKESALATLLAAVMDPVVPLAEVLPDLPGSICNVVQCALQKPKALRYPDMATLREGLLSIDPATVAARAGPPAAPPGVEGERRVIAVLLADDVTDREAIERAVEANGGVVYPIAGGRAIGIFGGELWAGDELQRAIAAALVCRASAARIVVASGHATRRRGEISGAALATAEACCSPSLSGVLIDARAAKVISQSYTLAGVAPGVYAVKDELHGTLRRRAPGSRLVGRTAELAQIDGAITAAVEEQRLVIALVTGPPGIGKTRLAEVMEERFLAAAGLEARVLHARAQHHQRRASFSLLRGAIEAHAAHANRQELHAEAALEERQHAVLMLVREGITAGEISQCADFFGELLGVPMPDTPQLVAARSDPQLMKDHLSSMLRQYLGGLAASAPLLMVLEDLQWADRESLEVLHELADELADRPVLFFATARPELEPASVDLFVGRDVLRIEPGPLGAGAVAELAALSAGRELPAPVLRALAERTGGNPLFVEEIVQALVETDGLDAAPETLPLPLTVETAIQARLDALPLEEKDAVKRAAIFGRPFYASELEAVGVEEAPARLAALVRKNLFAQRARAKSGRGPELSFRSSLAGEVARGMLDETIARDCHRRAAAHLAALAEPDREEVAFHYERCGETALAAEHYAGAVRQHARRGDSERVLGCVERALALGAPAEHRYELYMAANDALFFLGRHGEQEAMLAGAEGAAASDGERARALTERVKLSFRTGRTEQAIAIGERAIDCARRGGDEEVLALALGRSALALAAGKRRGEAHDRFDEAERLLRASSPLMRGLAAGWQGQLFGQEGDLEKRRDAFERAAALYAEAGDVRRSAAAAANLADGLNRTGCWDEAIAALHEAIEGCRRVGNRAIEGYALANLGYALSMSGRFDEAIDALDAAIDRAARRKDPRLDVSARVYRARALLARSPGSVSRADLEVLVQLADAAGQDVFAIGALALAARAELDRGEVESALLFSSRALEARDRLGSIEEDEAAVFLVHARALLAAGRAADAGEVIRRGQARLQAIAARIQSPALRSSFLERIPAHRELMAVGLQARDGS